MCNHGGSCSETSDGTKPATNAFFCLCENCGYTGGGLNQSCEDINECEGDPCGPGGKCSESGGGGDLHNGKPIKAGVGLGKYWCTCDPYYVGGGLETACKATECSEGPCGAGGTCKLLTGGANPGDSTKRGFECECADGYEGGGVDTQCTDIKECAVNGNPCGAGNTCTEPKPGKFHCECGAGFTGSGARPGQMLETPPHPRSAVRHPV